MKDTKYLKDYIEELKSKGFCYQDKENKRTYITQKGITYLISKKLNKSNI